LYAGRIDGLHGGCSSIYWWYQSIFSEYFYIGAIRGLHDLLDHILHFVVF
jgi:hypothetical protein